LYKKLVHILYKKLVQDKKQGGGVVLQAQIEWERESGGVGERIINALIMRR